jgi:hypothetical protein
VGAWVRIGLVTALVSLRADAVARFRGEPLLPGPGLEVVARWRLVPMLLTLGFLWLAARAGRRAAEERSRGGLVLTAVAAAAGAAAPVAVLAALASAWLSLRFPGIGLGIRVDPGSAAAGGALLAAAGAAVGVWLRRAGRGAAPLRGGLAGYGWALALATGVTLVVAAFEPSATRAYVEGLRGLGTGGGLLFGLHVLALPAQSALLLAPAAGSCLHLLGEGPLVDLCPWSLRPAGPPATFLGGPLALTPWLLALHAVPPVAAALAGRAGVRGATVGQPHVRGALAGAVLAGLAVAGAWLASPRVAGDLAVMPAPAITFDPVAMGATWLLWGVLGGAVGGWLEGRAAGIEPQPPRRTSV